MWIYNLELLPFSKRYKYKRYSFYPVGSVYKERWEENNQNTIG
jgi:hypothetical protein